MRKIYDKKLYSKTYYEKRKKTHIRKTALHVPREDLLKQINSMADLLRGCISYVNAHSRQSGDAFGLVLNIQQSLVQVINVNEQTELANRRVQSWTPKDE